MFRPVLSGQSTEPTPGIHQVSLTGTLEPGDVYSLSIDSSEFNYEVRPGDTADEVLDNIALQVNESASQGVIELVSAERDGSNLILSTLDGATRTVSGSTRNTSEAVDDLSVSLDSSPDDTYRLSLEGTTEPGDQVVLSIGSRSFSYVVPRALEQANRSAVMQDLVSQLSQSGLFSESVDISIDPLDETQVVLTPTRDNIGDVSATIVRTSINDQGISISLTQGTTPCIARACRVFQSHQAGLSAASKRHTRSDPREARSSRSDAGYRNPIARGYRIRDGFHRGRNFDQRGPQASAGDDVIQSEDLGFTTAITELQSKLMSLRSRSVIICEDLSVICI